LGEDKLEAGSGDDVLIGGQTTMCWLVMEKTTCSEAGVDVTAYAVVAAKTIFAEDGKPTSPITRAVNDLGQLT
jgi:long-subunit acyl-CoA synthetase (AMP-forming)